MSTFERDNEEYNLINLFPTDTQRKYGRPDVKDIQLKYQRVDLATHLKRINSIFQNTHAIPKPKTSIPKPKTVKKVDKTKITLTGIV